MLHSPIMPFLIFNLGTEMLYILQQRLQAQNIPPLKASRVLSDVSRTMLTPQFIEALFQKQPMYSHQESRKIFDRLAHSSIMRLSKPSMDKLYDLMTMGLKYQLLQGNDVTEILQLTLNHLDVVFDLVSEAELLDVVRTVLTRLSQLSKEELSLASWKLIQEQLYDFFQDKHIKVSLFLNAGIQYQNGMFVIQRPLTQRQWSDKLPETIRIQETNNDPTRQKFAPQPLVLPYAEEKPGLVKYFDSDEASAAKKPSRTEEISQHPYNDVAMCAEGCSHLNTRKRSCPYGYNMYLDDKKKSGSSSSASDGSKAVSSPPSAAEEEKTQQEFSSTQQQQAESQQQESIPTSFSERLKQYSAAGGSSSAASANSPTAGAPSKSSEQEFNLLAHILGGVQKETKGKIANENILHISNLFGNNGKNDEPQLSDQELQAFGIGSGASSSAGTTVRFDSSKNRSDALNNLMKDFDIGDEKPSGAAGVKDSAAAGNENGGQDQEDSGGQDLLDLMDMA